MSLHEREDEAWAERVLDHLRNDLWSARQSSMLEHLSKDRVEAILNKLREELWSATVDATNRDAWATRIIGRLRDELWSSPGKPSRKKMTPDEEKRVDAILARLKQDLWAT